MQTMTFILLAKANCTLSPTNCTKNNNNYKKNNKITTIKILPKKVTGLFETTSTYNNYQLSLKGDVNSLKCNIYTFIIHEAPKVRTLSIIKWGINIARAMHVVHGNTVFIREETKLDRNTHRYTFSTRNFTSFNSVNFPGVTLRSLSIKQTTQLVANYLLT